MTSDIPAFPSEQGGGDIPPFPSSEGGKAAPKVDPKGAIGYQPSMWEETKDYFRRLLPEKIAKDTSGARTAIDMAGSTPAMVAGTMSDAAARIAAATDVAHLKTHREISAAGNEAYNKAQALANPLSKLLGWAGVGREEDKSGLALAMNKAGEILEQGGDKAEKATGGFLNKDDVKSIAHAAMALGGVKGMRAGLSKLAALHPEAATGAARLTPEAELSEQWAAARNSDDPMAPQKMAEQKVAAAEAAVQGKARLAEAKDLIFDPVKGTMEEKILEPGKELPKATALDRALEKASNGRLFDMTAEERIAFKGMMDKPLEQPIIDESGKILAAPSSESGKLELFSSYRPKTSKEFSTPKEQAAAEAWASIDNEPESYPGEAYEDISLKSKGLRSSVKYKGGFGQGGYIDPKLMARMAAVGVGAWAGYRFSDDKDFERAVLGGLAGLGAASYGPKAFATLRDALSSDSRIRINDLADAHEKYTQLAATDVWAEQKKIEDLVPKESDRNAITHAIEKGDLSKLTPEQQKAAKIATDYFHRIGSEASLEGVLTAARENYVTHLWDWSKNKGLFQRWMDQRGSGPGMSASNRFADERSIPTIEAGKQAGLTPVTEDISRIMGVYGNSMSRSIANAIFTRALRNEKVPGTDQSLVMSADKAPYSYVAINHPLMTGLRVHPDIAPSLKMLYDTSEPGPAMKILQGLSDTSKRTAVSFSLFHAKALTDAMIGGSRNPFAAVGKIPSFVAGTNEYLKELRKGSASPLVERAAEGGLKFSLEGEGAGSEDAGVGFYSAMEAAQEKLDAMIPHAGAPIKGLIEMNKKVDTLMWARLHAGMKLSMFAEKYQQLLDNAAKKGIALDKDQAARIAASYTNDIFGGLNWRRVAEDATTKFGRHLGQAMLNPGARRTLGLLTFAPDWTVSTTRAAVKAFGKPDMLNPTTLAGLHQQYLLRSALYYLIVGDAINHAMSGHHIWQNKDWTTIDMDPKGERKMQWSKHTMEPVHWVTKPGQQALNKLGMIPREALTQSLGVEYLSAKGNAPPMKNRMQHLLKNFAPIAMQQGSESQGTAVIAGFAGVPVYGKTAAEKKAIRERKSKEHKGKK